MISLNLNNSLQHYVLFNPKYIRIRLGSTVYYGLNLKLFLEDSHLCYFRFSDST